MCPVNTCIRSVIPVTLVFDGLSFISRSRAPIQKDSFLIGSKQRKRRYARRFNPENPRSELRFAPPRARGRISFRGSCARFSEKKKRIREERERETLRKARDILSPQRERRSNARVEFSRYLLVANSTVLSKIMKFSQRDNRGENKLGNLLNYLFALPTRKKKRA